MKPHHGRLRGHHSLSKALAVGATIAAVAVVLAIMAGAGRAGAHEAPAGWSYPTSCCSNQDCKPALRGEIRETREGYTLTTTGEFVAHGDRRIKPISQDGEFHVCQQGCDFDHGRILCLLIPPSAF